MGEARVRAAVAQCGGGVRAGSRMALDAVSAATAQPVEGLVTVSGFIQRGGVRDAGRLAAYKFKDKEGQSFGESPPTARKRNFQGCQTSVATAPPLSRASGP